MKRRKELWWTLPLWRKCVRCTQRSNKGRSRWWTRSIRSVKPRIMCSVRLLNSSDHDYDIIYVHCVYPWQWQPFSCSAPCPALAARCHPSCSHSGALAKPCEFKCFRRTDYDKINEGTPHTFLVFHSDLLLEPCCDLIFSLTAVSGLTRHPRPLSLSQSVFHSLTLATRGVTPGCWRDQWREEGCWRSQHWVGHPEEQGDWGQEAKNLVDMLSLNNFNFKKFCKV